MPLELAKKLELISTYTPILYFDPDENFIPVKPETYMQASALWVSKPAGEDSRHKKSNWSQIIPKGGISINSDEDLDPPEDVDGDGVEEVYIGHEDQDHYRPYLTSDENSMLWLDMAAWDDSEDVTEDSHNKLCNRERALRRWTTEEDLMNAKDWYYAEIVDSRGLISTLEILTGKRDSKNALFEESYIIWYYFLYPIHHVYYRICEQIAELLSEGNLDEALETDLRSQLNPADYEGDWNAVGVMVKRSVDILGNPTGQFKPYSVCFGQRTRGLVEDYTPLLRQKMDIYSWDGGEFHRVGTHPKVFVARDSHNNYSTNGPKEPPGISIADFLCGTMEDIYSTIKDFQETLEDIEEIFWAVVITAAKIIGGCVAGALIGGFIAGPGGAILGCEVGATIGGIAAILELLSNSGDEEPSLLDEEAMEEILQDHVSDNGEFSLVLSPPDLSPEDLEANNGEVRFWAEDDPAMHLVDRKAQIWWTRTNQHPVGYDGRWGVMCQNDPFDRKSGITFPDKDFQNALLVALSGDNIL